MIPLRFSGFTIFQPTRPLRGATGGQGGILSLSPYFNPRAPCGARPRRTKPTSESKNFNPRAPCGARRSVRDRYHKYSIFQPTRPLRGATVFILHGIDGDTVNFNPRAPCGARQQKCTNHYAHFCDNRQISDAFAQNAACQGILLLFDAGKPCGFWVRTAQVISAHLCFAL